MDYNGHQNTWNWHGENFGVQNNSDSDPSRDDWTQLTFNEEDHSYMFDETTPVKECGDLSYYFTHNDNIRKEPEDEREASSQIRKRCRMFRFDTHDVESSLFCEETPSTFLKSSETDHLTEEVLPDAFQWGAGFSEDASASSYEGLDQLCEGWLADYFNDADMFLSTDDMNLTAASDVHIDITELNNAPPEPGPDAVQKQGTQTSQNVVFKSRKSLNCPPSKLQSSIAYPFAFIKPCGFHGDVTLDIINQRIQTPPPSKLKESNALPFSAFSRKPIVGKTKIRTEGGKGSITIMRTKG
ncbi:Protein XRI1 [Hibiscus syriacus]|uniref:Protein XRI1 n=1 Tax=Hibiscus syriacus TaxID=106335 RepID=A0A6A2XVR8_HIBSY|nr:protein XRI1-like [Hibiscus syriacus]KAE8679668.1 Protein XRI1 [Hibiscus syriacus]